MFSSITGLKSTSAKKLSVDKGKVEPEPKIQRSLTSYGKDTVVDEGNPLRGRSRTNTQDKINIVEGLQNTRIINEEELKDLIELLNETE
jgi:hypothetical protein